ncbi:TPR-like protein [Gymnopus androsaceus JB14]|uniref:TPR-like protein n=1 Tax=Gymnopus androsaceus JB14 TaxID=1447944 RepID=A0A6A4I3M3_9AGAR|nr:TPR-like protein [Gymnopus androsaceus JB14]
MTSQEQNYDIAKKQKEAGDKAFREGDLKAALASYHGALMYAQGLDKNAFRSMGMGAPASGGQEQEKTEVDEFLEKIYNNMSACHMKVGNWKRTQETAEKVLKKNDKNYKALYRKAKALAEQGYLERAYKVFEELKTKNPDEATLYEQELARYKAIDAQREKANNAKLKGFLNKAEKKAATASEDTPASEG